MLYEAAWGARRLAEPEVATGAGAALTEPGGGQEAQRPARRQFPLPEVPLDKVPLQPAEKKAARSCTRR